MKKIILLIISLTLTFTACKNVDITENYDNYSIDKIDPSNIEAISATPTIEESDDTDDVATIKDSVLLDVPFADQAPFKDWGDPYQEACEETSAIMAYQFVVGNTENDLSKKFIDQEILNMVSYQENNLGGHYDLDTAGTLDLFQQYYNYQDGQIVSINSIDDIKCILSEGNIIIAPTYGRELDNPHFTPPGPVYHMLLIKGYNDSHFITNDPGVWQGKNFNYTFDNLFKAICDLPSDALGQSGYIKSHPELMANCNKNVIVVRK